MPGLLRSKTTTRPVSETAAALKDELERRSVHLFAEIDHAKAARAVNLDLRETRVLLFGNPAAGTPLMQQNESVALALPLKMLVCASATGTQIAYQPLREQAPTFGLAPDLPILAKLDAFMESLLAAVI